MVRRGLLLVILIGFFSNSAAAANYRTVNKAVNAMMSACQKEYPVQLKSKGVTEVVQWAEEQEEGPNADAFRKTRCYAKHEKWESVTGQGHAAKGETIKP